MTAMFELSVLHGTRKFELKCRKDKVPTLIQVSQKVSQLSSTVQNIWLILKPRTADAFPYRHIDPLQRASKVVRDTVLQSLQGELQERLCSNQEESEDTTGMKSSAPKRTQVGHVLRHLHWIKSGRK